MGASHQSSNVAPLEYRIVSAFALSLTLATAVSTADTVALRSDVPDPVACERPAESMAACTLTAFRLSGADERPVLDGRLDDPVWALATAAVEFRQFEPDPGEPGSERTEARILYDGDALYVGMRMYDSSPDQIRAQFVRRDDHEAVSDWAHVFLDSYHDRRTAFHFATTPTGTRVDILHLEDTEQNVAWDAVWQVETSIDAEGWSAEFRIPLSQLRFGSAEEMTWGVNFMRQIARRSETSHWAQILPESGRLVSLFGDLDGLSGLEAPGRLELLPYSVARLRREDVDDADPFRGDNDVWGSTGLDLKYGVTSNLTLTATVNPDFGQVDADPSVVNLGTRETFYPENRPFFLEGAEIFRFPLVPEGHAFYSRRIGRPPQLGASAPSGGFVDMPETVRILGAMKLSGKTSSGWSVGVLHAITSREEAQIAAPDELVTAQAVEPLTNYSVARVVRDFRDGQSGLGAIATATHRDRDDEAFDRLRSSAFVGGLNGWHRFNGSRYQLRGWLLGSHVRGSEDAIARTQRSFVHLHQREDADHLTYDPTRTSLSGIAGEFFFEKIGGGHWTLQLGGGGRGPGVDTNDAGYISYTDVVYGDVRARYREFNPGSIFHNWYVEGEGFLASTLGGEIARPSLHLKMEGQLLNFWTATLNVDHWGSQMWPWELRGGPALRRPSYTRYQGILSSDSRKSWQAQLRGTYRRDNRADGTVVTLDPLLALRPSSRATVSLSPSISWNRNPDQYVAGASRADGGDREYVMGWLDQTTAALTLQLSYSFTPDLALDFYVQPFMSSGQYSRFRRVVDPGAGDFDDRLALLNPAVVTLEGGHYHVDETGEGDPEFSFRDRDFNVRELSTNAVLRWEYKPGSTLFIVWSSARDDDLVTGDLDMTSDLDRLLSAPVTNIFMVKFSYWLGF